MATWELSRRDGVAERARKLAEIALAGAAASPQVLAVATADVARALEIYAGFDAAGQGMAPAEPTGPDAGGGFILEHGDPRQAPLHRFGLRPERWNSLRGKVFWITGAGTGYGRAIATVLGLAGARLVLSGRRAGPLAEAAEQIAALAEEARILVAPLDVADPDRVAATVGAIDREFGRLDGLACGAALPGNPGSVLGMDDAELRRLLDVNVLGVAYCCRAAVPLMARRNRCRVVLFSSEAAWGFPPGIGVYAMTKAAVNGLGGTLAGELAVRLPEADIQVNILDPGEARTEMNRNSEVSAFAVCSMALALLSHPEGGPNGRFFHRDGRHLSYGYIPPWPHSVC
ncbi:SDR family oxidoreductase [Magnetospirillum sp. SS-4]|uniref:SDR family oxidoreductase n=1 Tax=Magnetospirillum sp. SS-4 TaxID=2681465 RepID=UPI00137D0EFE|nr:SDR family oxidoreductase [Magnetospirillum sp. SS-4]CAA7627149.1 Putative Carbonyl reductase (NADPH) (modular protein) [Magnetospirillum sp. SS-4]